MEENGIIRKISVGDIKDGITYKVDQEMFGGRILIEQISLDVEALSMGIKKYNIYVSRNDDEDNVRLWKVIENMPVAVEYDIDVVEDV